MATEGLKRLEGLYLKKIRSRIDEIQGRIWTRVGEVKDASMAETMEHLALQDAKKLKYKAARAGSQWGKPWSTAWFRLRVTIPKSLNGETVALVFADAPGECIVFCDGKPIQSLDPNHRECILAPKARGGERVELYVEAGSASAFGGFSRRPVVIPQLAILNPEVHQAYWDLAALYDMVDPGEYNLGWSGKVKAHALDADDPRRARVIFGLNKAVDLFDYQDTACASLAASARRVIKTLKPLYACRANESAQTFACMGHAHIDVAWLWPLAETVRKCGRTFSNVLSLMDRYPEFVFCQSQPHLYEFTRDRYPSLYKRIKQKAKQGKWVPTGCSWVEMDCNVTSGESFVRQTLFGTRFFQKEFGHTPVCLWLPDVFGYSAALPQILKLSGIDNFLTQKISWSQFTSFPHHSFYWQGIDGTKVLSHFLPNEDYNSQLMAPHMMSAQRAYREKARSGIQAVLYGFGDGGGGPAVSHLERVRRYRDLEGMPKLTPMSPTEFFQRLRDEAVDLPTWVGELYLEYHRGTYTTQGWTKRHNRKAEFLLRETEMLSAINLPDGGRYDHERLNAAWKTVLLNQFHDILPGSSIDEVYEDTERDYAEAFRLTNEVRAAALARRASAIDTRGDGTPVLAFNSLSWERSDTIAVEADGKVPQVAVAPDGARVPVQKGHDGLLRFNAAVPSLGHTVFHLCDGEMDGDAVEASPLGMENECVRIRFDRQGRLVSVYDKEHGREALDPSTPANQFLLFEDKQVSCGDAWDIDIYYNDKLLERDGELLSAKVIEQGPVRSVVRFTRRISKSVITQDAILTAGSARIDFATKVEWADEKDVLLKVAFPVSVHSEKARYEIQFGNVERPTHWNMPQDFARFEVPAQKWVDLSEHDYGVALLNDCKYGHDTRGNVMRLTLLRAPKSPGKTADVNKTHIFTYALLPHAGDFTNGVVRSGYELNAPISAWQVKATAGRLPPSLGAFSITGENVIIETVKKAEDDKGLIVRLYEAHGCRGRRTLTTGLPAKAATEVNLMEKPIRELKLRNGKMALDFKPFQIRTVKFTC